MIIIDWGTSNFRAWWIDDASGEVRDEITSGRGMASLTSEECPRYCLERVGHWRGQGAAPIYMAGMVGMAQGWQHAPQLTAPVTLRDLVAHVVAAPGVDDAWIVPGVRMAGDDPDVMRGEEVQVFGALALADRRDAVLCLPGTHSKWARVSDGRLMAFSTSMTGEVYALLLAHSILGRTGSAEPQLGAANTNALEAGLAESGKSTGLLHQLFTARSRNLYGNLSACDVPAYLSGILIGNEVHAMSMLYPADQHELLVVGADALRDPYQRALQHGGRRCRWIDGRDASIRGMRELVKLHRMAREMDGCSGGF